MAPNYVWATCDRQDYNERLIVTPKGKNPNDAYQCKMARAVLGWSAHELAVMTDIGLSTLNRFDGGMNSRENSAGKIHVALAKAGIKFDTDGQGVRLKPPAKGKRQAEVSGSARNP